jgi:alpha-ketoglutarate-dependent taurine dioxygenase
MTIGVRSLSDALGIELSGIDLRHDQPDDVRARAAAGLREHLLVLIRDQDIDVADQARFVSWFGPVDTNGYASGFPEDHPEMFITNTRADGVARLGSLLQHQDHCFFERVLPGICLYAEEVPAEGGDTIFTNASLALRRLPPPLRHQIDPLQAIHLYDYANDYGTERFRIARSPNAPTAVHPVVMENPATDEAVLFVNELMTDSILGLDDEDSESLLHALWSYLADPAVQYRHQWRTGDVILWDNRSLQHGRSEFDPRARRCLRRLQVG